MAGKALPLPFLTMPLIRITAHRHFLRLISRPAQVPPGLGRSVARRVDHFLSETRWPELKETYPVGPPSDETIRPH